MSISYLHQAREALKTALEAIDFVEPGVREAIWREIVLRPPKEKSFGDLSTNASILLKSHDNIDLDKAVIALLAALRGLDGIADVRYEENGYINLKYSADYWRDQLPLILTEGTGYGVGGITLKKCVVSAPDEVNDLLSCRQQVNAEALERIAVLVGAEVERQTLPSRTAVGFPLASAIGKCTEAKTRFALIANPPAFIEAFSPILAIDKSYDNPVFAIPYARMMLEKLSSTSESAKSEMNDGVDMSVLKLPVEMELARGLCDWPQEAERTLKTGEGFYLASFLHKLSLLFFRLFDRVHPVSSPYLTEATEGPARLVLLGALKSILSGGAALLGVDTVKEYG